MLLPLDEKERRVLHQLCSEPWMWNRRYDCNVSLRLERRGLAQLSLLGQLCPTPAGRLKDATMTL
jgi:hypothetical protein